MRSAFGADLYRTYFLEKALSTYETDEEKVEALKKWWKENGVSVIGGITIGLGAVFGWRAWIDYHDRLAQEASAAFEQLIVSVETGNADSARQQSKLIREEYGSTPYSALAALMEARVEVDAGDATAAQAALKQAISQAPDPAIAQVAVLRLVRVLIDQGDLPEAKALIDKHDRDDGFSPDFAALRGDIAAAGGDNATARAAYTLAIAAGAANAEMLGLKLENLPPAE